MGLQAAWVKNDYLMAQRRSGTVSKKEGMLSLPDDEHADGGLAYSCLALCHT
jgi:hypothetical protein